MDQALINAAAAMRASEQRLEMLSHNLANTSTTGYKRKSTTNTQFVLQTRGREERVQGTTFYTDFAQGDLHRTGLPYDLALMGDGFFAVEGPEGELYTRGGNFLVDAEGVLTTPDGLALAWEERIAPIDPLGYEPVIDEEGRAYQGDTALGRLRVVDFESRERLIEQNGGYWKAPAGLIEQAPTARVYQGSIEGSNATGMAELIEMLVTQRSYEMAATTIQMIDQSYKRLNQPR